MKNDYGMVTVKDYLDSLNNVKCLTINEQEIRIKVKKYLLNLKRYETNAKIVEALIA